MIANFGALLVLFKEFIYFRQCEYTVNVERFAGLNNRSFSPIKFLQEYFRSALATGVYCLPIAKNSWETFAVFSKTTKVLPSESFPIYSIGVGRKWLHLEKTSHKTEFGFDVHSNHKNRQVFQ